MWVKIAELGKTLLCMEIYPQNPHQHHANRHSRIKQRNTKEQGVGGKG